MTPNELARELGVTGAAIRQFLREEHTRPPNRWGKAWALDQREVAAVRERFKTPFGRAESRHDMVTLSVAIPVSLRRWLGTKATRDHRSLNDIVREALIAWLVTDQRDEYLKFLAYQEQGEAKR